MVFVYIWHNFLFFVNICLSLSFKCSLYEKARRLEQEAHPALDKLTSKISTLNLERVRQIKSRLVAITGRVQKVEFSLFCLSEVCDVAMFCVTK